MFTQFGVEGPAPLHNYLSYLAAWAKVKDITKMTLGVAFALYCKVLCYD